MCSLLRHTCEERFRNKIRYVPNTQRGKPFYLLKTDPQNEGEGKLVFSAIAHPPNLPPPLKSIFSHQVPLPGALGPGPDHNGHRQLQGFLSYAVLAAVATIAVATIHWIFLIGCWILTSYTDPKEEVFSLVFPLYRFMNILWLP